MPYRIEYAASNRALCKGPKPCAGTVLTKGSLRFGSIVDFKGNTSLVWRHWGCVTPKIFENLKSELDDISELDGYDELNDKDKARLDGAWSAGHVADADIPDSARQPVGYGDEGNDKVARAKERKRKDEVGTGNETKTTAESEDNTTFKGRTPGGISCEQFVLAVRKHSIVEEKARDDNYIADYVMSCLDGEALHWSETLPVEVQRNWTLLRRALLTEYSTSSFSSAISSALIPTPAAAPSFSAAANGILTSLPGFVATSFSNATTAIPSTTSVVQASPQCNANWANVPITSHGRIRMTVDTATYYVAESHPSIPMCLATQDISNAATLEAIDTNGSVELQFVHPGPRHGSWLGMVWESKPFEVGTYAMMLPAKVQGSSTVILEGTLDPSWGGDISVMKWTRSTKGLLLPRRGFNGEILKIALQLSRTGGDNFLYLCDLNTPLYRKGYTPKEVRLVFEPL